MNAVPFDTLKLARDFQEAGLAPPVAAGAASALADALIGADLVTKTDLQATKTDLQTGLASLESRFEAKFAALEAKLEILRRDMIIKLGGMMIVAVGVLLTAMRFMPHP